MAVYPGHVAHPVSRRIGQFTEWVGRKAADYHLVEDSDLSPLIDRLRERIRSLTLPETHDKFVDEMRLLSRQRTV